MNKKQKTCLLVSMATMVVMGLFPPWVLETEKMNFLGNQRYEVRHTTEPGPYSWIDYPPSRPKATRATAYSDRNDLAARAKFIDLYRLGLQYFVVAVVTIGLVITFRDEKATKQ